MVISADVLEQARTQAAFCRIFGSYRRILIAWYLAEGEASVGEIADVLGFSLQNTSQHLRIMTDRGLLTSRRDGTLVFYSLAKGILEKHCGAFPPTGYFKNQTIQYIEEK
jgi:DNA-binding transcriptional ArsR family regulator